MTWGPKSRTDKEGKKVSGMPLAYDAIISAMAADAETVHDQD